MPDWYPCRQGPQYCTQEQDKRHKHVDGENHTPARADRYPSISTHTVKTIVTSSFTSSQSWQPLHMKAKLRNNSVSYTKTSDVNVRQVPALITARKCRPKTRCNGVDRYLGRPSGIRSHRLSNFRLNMTTPNSAIIMMAFLHLRHARWSTALAVLPAMRHIRSIAGIKFHLNRCSRMISQPLSDPVSPHVRSSSTCFFSFAHVPFRFSTSEVGCHCSRYRSVM